MPCRRVRPTASPRTTGQSPGAKQSPMALGESDRRQLDPPPSPPLRYRRARPRPTHLTDCHCARAERVRQPPRRACVGNAQPSPAIPPPKAHLRAASQSCKLQVPYALIGVLTGVCVHARAYAFRYIDCHIPNRTQPGHCTRATHHHRTGDSRMVSRLVVIVHVLKVQNAPRPVRFSRVNTHLGASSCHQHGECVPPRRLELRRRPVVQVHITILVVRLCNALALLAPAARVRH